MPFYNPAVAFGENFLDNVSWNSALAPYRAKPKLKGIALKGIAWIMAPEDLIKKLKELGISINRSTLTRYVQWGLVTPPKQRIGGKGVRADYPEHAVAEAAASYKLLHGDYRIKVQKVAETREIALKLEQDPMRCHAFFTNPLQYSRSFVLDWWIYKLRVENGIHEEPVEIELTITPNKVVVNIKPSPDNDLFETITVYEDFDPEVGKRIIASLC